MKSIVRSHLITIKIKYPIFSILTAIRISQPHEPVMTLLDEAQSLFLPQKKEYNENIGTAHIHLKSSLSAGQQVNGIF